MSENTQTTAGGGQTTPDTTAPTTTTNNNNNTTGGRTTTPNRGARNNSSVVQEVDRNFEGKTPEIGGILALKSERVSKKVPFETFRELLAEYLAKELDRARDVLPIVTEMKDPKPIFATKNKIVDLTEDEQKSLTKREMHKKKVTLYVDREEKIDDNIDRIFALIWGQCTNSLQSAIIGLDEYEEKKSDSDVIWLLESLKVTTAGISSKSNKYKNLIDALLVFFTMRQGETESNDAFLKRFKSNAQTLELAGGEHMFYSEQLDGDSPSDEELLKAKEKFKSVLFMERCDHRRYSDLMRTIKKDSGFGRDDYPDTLASAFDLLVHEAREITGGNTRRPNGGRGDGGRRNRVQFVQQDRTTNGNRTLVPGVSGQIFASIDCYHCGEPGHRANDCPVRARGEPRRGTSMFLRSFQFNQNQSSLINPTWILLDTCSTSSVSNNASLIQDIRKCERDEDKLVLNTNGGSIGFDSEAKLKLFPLDVHYNEHSLATVLSLKDVADIPGYRLTMDTFKERGIRVHLPDGGPVFKFKECADGLYYFDTAAPGDHTVATDDINDISAIQLLQTVQENLEFYSKTEIEGADLARRLQRIIWWPSTRDYKSYISHNLLHNSPVTVDDVNRAENAYGPAKPMLQGKMKRRTPPYGGKYKKFPLPLQVLDRHKFVQVYIDFFFVNKLPFLHTKSGILQFLTVELVNNRKGPQIIAGLNEVRQIYQSRGFRITNFHADNEFDIESVHEALLPAELNIYARNEHVAIVERSIQTIKERCRCTCHSLPYEKYSRLMTKHLVEGAVHWLNAFPPSNGISKTLSPANIVIGTNKPDMSVKRIAYGSSAIVYGETKNNMHSRGEPAIALNPSNDRGGCNFMSTHTGKEIHGYQWQELPISQEVIDRVHELADGQKESYKLVNRAPLFEWAPGVTIQDIANDDNDETEDNNNQNEMEIILQDEENSSDSEEEETESEDEIEEREERDENVDEDQNVITDDDDLSEETYDEDDTNENIVNDSNISLETDEGNDEETEIEVENSNIQINTDDNEIEVQHEDTTYTNSRPVRSNAGQGVERLQVGFEGKSYQSQRAKQLIQAKAFQRKGKKAKQLLQAMHEQQNEHRKEDDFKHQIMRKAVDIIFAQVAKIEEEGIEKYAQIPAKQGFKIFGERAVAAMFKEFEQLTEGAMPGKPVIAPVDPKTLTREMIQQALEAVNLIKEKRSGKIKGRTCANGSEQWKYLREDESVASPTVSLEALFTSLIIDALEGRDIAVFDIPGAFLHPEVPEDKMILMVLRDTFVDIMCEVNPAHIPNVTYDSKGRKVLYVKCIRSIYGCIEAAMLWYELYVTTLKDMGFEVNPYDRCVANAMINGKQCTIAWYVDDNKISHMDSKVIDNILEKIEKDFGKLTTTRGDEHTFLGMKIKIKDKKIMVDMREQIEEAIEAFEKLGDLLGDESVASPASKNLMTVDVEEDDLEGKQREVFHSVVAKLLFIMKRARPDIDTAIAFLCTRVTKSKEGDWKKLKRVLRFLKKTIDDIRVIGASSVEDLFLFIDAAYAVHNDMRSQTGGCLSMGHGIIHGKSSKQKLNAKSSTEAEIIGVSEYLPYDIWLMMFLEAQGYELRNNILFQDNQSAIRMEKNGRNSCTGNSRHINVRYFWVKDRVDQDEIQVKYCPTHLMVADYFTKPLQGSLFREFREIIMGWKPLSDLIHRISIKERVETSNQNVIESRSSNKTDVEENVTKNVLVKGKEKREKSMDYRAALLRGRNS